jgi:predicted AlkP superfamily pyrophosphatase or phosphodiesterase
MERINATMHNRIQIILLITAMAFGAPLSAQTKKESNKPRTLIVIFDGLRPDYITQELMPNVYKLKQEGAYGNQHHSVFPTVTRVNASSYSTGSYPEQHGLMGNTVYFPGVSKTRGLDTGDAEQLEQASLSVAGNLLTATSFGEVMQAQGNPFMVFSSGSTGQALLQNHKVSGGLIINPEMILPKDKMGEVVKVLGNPPPDSTPNTARHAWVTDGLLHYALKPGGPQVSAIWYSDPDASAHAKGIGAELSNISIKGVDEQFGRVIAHLKNNSLYEQFNLVIATDHGFVTHVGQNNLADFLVTKGLKAGKESEDVVVVGGALYIKDGDGSKIKSIVSALQKEPWIGALFTRAKQPNSFQGIAEGTLSFETIHWNHRERSADILVDMNWDDRKNEHGFKGTSFSRGVAGHGTSSPYEIHIPLICSGPSFKRSFVSDLPTSNIDIVPTILHILNVPIPPSMQGRVMDELLLNTAMTKKGAKVEKVETQVTASWGTYKLVLEKSIWKDREYVNYTRTERIPSNQSKKDGQ